MSRTLRILIVAVVAFGAVGGYWKLVLAPKRAQVAELDQQIATQQAQLAQTQTLIATYQGAKDEYKANYTTVARLGKAVPATDDTRSLVVQLDAAAKRSNVDFDSISINGGGGAATARPSRRAPSTRGRSPRCRSASRSPATSRRWATSSRAWSGSSRSRVTRSRSTVACCAWRAST